LFVFAKEESSQFLFFHFFVKKKERKKTMDLFFTYLLMIPSCKLCFDDFFSLFVRLFVCLVCCNPGKTITTKEKLKRERENVNKKFTTRQSTGLAIKTVCMKFLKILVIKDKVKVCYSLLELLGLTLSLYLGSF